MAGADERTVSVSEGSSKPEMLRQLDSTVQLRVKRVPVDYDSGNSPELGPLFANHFELIRLNADIFLDIGIVSPEYMVEMLQNLGQGEEQDAPTVEFSVLQRVVMSPVTFLTLCAKLTGLKEQIEKEFGNIGAQPKSEKAE